MSESPKEFRVLVLEENELIDVKERRATSVPHPIEPHAVRDRYTALQEKLNDVGKWGFSLKGVVNIENRKDVRIFILEK